ncbi:MAG TPA: signal peptidase II [Bryobacteraceae bacterium]|nr:signal peptidase II [Bryobacteraceae bacterium]
MSDLRLKAYGAAAAVFAVDRLTKWLIETHVSFLDTLRVIPGFFDIVHAQNRGIAFSLFSDSSSEWRSFVLPLFALVAAIVVAGILWRPERLDRLSLAGFSLILGGAVGNLFDRIVWGRVTDFLDVYVGDYHWPTFNVADSAVVIGSGLLLLELVRPKRQAANVP